MTQTSLFDVPPPDPLVQPAPPKRTQSPPSRRYRAPTAAMGLAWTCAACGQVEVDAEGATCDACEAVRRDVWLTREREDARWWVVTTVDLGEAVRDAMVAENWSEVEPEERKEAIAGRIEGCCAEGGCWSMTERSRGSVYALHWAQNPWWFAQPMPTGIALVGWLEDFFFEDEGDWDDEGGLRLQPILARPVMDVAVGELL